MNPIETRNAVRQFIKSNRFKKALECIKKWGVAHANDWIVDEVNRLFEELGDLPEHEYRYHTSRIAALADCIVTGGFPEIGGIDKQGSKGSASDLEEESSGKVSSEMSGASDDFALISEGSAPETLPVPFFEDVPRKKKASARPSPTAGDVPEATTGKVPTVGSKSKPVFGAKPPPAPVLVSASAPLGKINKPVALSVLSPPQTGGLLYHIPSTMKQNEDTTCIVRIAFDKTQLKTADDTFDEEVVKDIRVSRLMEIEMENEGTEDVFKIVAKSEKQQSVDTFEATEWRFSVRPLVSGTHSLLLKVTIVDTDANGKETRKEKILEEEIVITTQKAPFTEGVQEGFVSADLKLTDLKTLLFMGANPPGTRVLQLEVEHSRIATKINNRFRIEVEKFLSAGDIPELIIDKKPTIIHFSGHGKDPDGNEESTTNSVTRAVGKIETVSDLGGIVVFDEDMRGLKVVDDAALDFMFQNIKTNFDIPIEIVVFNSCYSESQARVIGKYVPYVVGSARAIGDEVAIAFAAGFYFGISKGLSVEKAFSSGKMQAVLADIQAKDLIVLYRDGIKLVL